MSSAWNEKKKAFISQVSHASGIVPTQGGQTSLRTITRRWFFVALSGLTLASVLVAFSRTFYLRPLFDVPSVPAYVYAHGALLTAWFVLFFVQTVLVATHRTVLHRRLGILGAGIAVVLVPLSVMVVLRAVPRFLASGMTNDHIAGAAIGDLASLLLFSGLIASAVRLRRRPEAHRRLMLFASLCFVGPVLSRLVQQGLPVPSVPVVLISGTVLLVAYDVVCNQRLHEATVWGSIAVVGGLTLATTIAARTSDAVVSAFLPPRDVQSIQTVFPVSSVAASTQWYRDVLGFTALVMGDAANPSAAIVTRDGAQIFLKKSDAPVLPRPAVRDSTAVGWPARRLDAYVRVRDAHAFREVVLTHLADVEPVAKTSYGCDEFSVMDPDQHVIVVGECHF